MAPQTHGSVKVVLETQPTNIAVARRFAGSELEGSVPPEVVADLKLITSELFTNACEHGGGTHATVRIDRSPHRVCVTVTSEGPAPDVSPVESWEVPSGQSANGRGLGVVRKLAERVEISHGRNDFSVTACIRLADASP